MEKTRGTIRSTDAEIAQMKAAFERVENKEHWKNPIDTTLDSLTPADEELITDAVIFYAGCVPTFTKLPNGKIRVTAAGYFNSVGA